MKVLSIPAEHAYCQAITPRGVEVLADPDADGQGNWWPHPALEASWWRDGRGEGIDLLHIHFGFEHRSADQLRELVAAVDEAGVGLVLTAHDLDNPHLIEQGDYHEALGVLARAAAAVVTLTDCAAGILDSRYGLRDVTVIPHPRVVPTSWTADPAVDRRGGAAAFVKSQRANVVDDPSFYAAVAGEVPLTVYAHDEPGTLAFREQLAARGVEVVVHARLNDDQLFTTLASHDTCLLPYVRGTHSGWLEMCRDLGVRVAVPDSGCYADQADSPEAVEVYATGDGLSAAAAAARLLEAGSLPYQGDRGAQAESVREAYSQIYARVAGTTTTAGGMP